MSKPDFDNNNNSCNDEVDVGGGGVPNGIVDDEILKGNSSALVFVCLPEKDQLELIEEASNEVVNHHQIQPGTTTTSGVITVIEKLPDENEEDFRLRRIVELLSNLPLNSRKMLWDKAHSRLDQLFPGSGEGLVQCSFKMKTIDLRQPGDGGGDNGDGRGRGGSGGGGGATQGGEGDTKNRRLLCFSCFQ